MVAHDQHERGVGTALLRELGRIARHAGQHHFVADVLAENYAMRRVVNDAGWPTIERRDGSVVSVDVNLDDIDESSEVAAPQSAAALVATDARKTPRTAAMTFGGDPGT